MKKERRQRRRQKEKEDKKWERKGEEREEKLPAVVIQDYMIQRRDFHIKVDTRLLKFEGRPRFAGMVRQRSYGSVAL